MGIISGNMKEMPYTLSVKILAVIEEKLRNTIFNGAN